MRVALLGMFGFSNFGNEASLVSAVRALRGQLPGVDLFCICTRPRGVTAAYELEAIPLNLRALGEWWGLKRAVILCLRRVGLIRIVGAVQAYRIMRGADALVIPGTGILDDYGLRPFGVPLDMLIWCAAARLRGAKVMFVSVGAGPITNPRTLTLMKAAASLAAHRSFRDSASREFMKVHGLDVSEDRVVPDIVFSLEPESVGPSRTDVTDGLTVAVGVMNYHGWNTQGERREETYRRHVEDAAEIVRGVIERGCSVRVIGGEIDDQGAVRDVYERVCSLGKSYADRCTAPSLLDFDDLFRELGECDLVIATRFHNVVCSLILGKPVLSVGYADKNRDLLKEFGLGEYAHDIETLSVGRLLEQFDEVVGRRVELERSIACTARRYRVEIRGYMDGLWETLGL